MKFILFFLSLSSLAFDDIERNIRENIIRSAPNFSEIDQLVKTQKEKPQEDPYPHYKALVEDAPVVKLMLRAHTLVINPQTKEEKEVPKDIFVTGKLIKKTGNYQIFNKENRPVFEIKGADAHLVEEAIDLDPIPKTLITYEKNELNKPLDKKFSLTHSLSLNKQSIDASYFSSFFNNNANTADALKLDYKLFHKTDFPIAFGLVASFDLGDYNGGAYSGLFLGAGIKSPLRLSEALLLEAHLIFERSLYLDVNSTSFSAYYFQGNVEAIFKDRYFLNFSYGSSTFSANNQWINTAAGSNTGTNFGIGLGIKFYSDIYL